MVWAAPAAPEIVHRATDRLGHRLRGESEPDRTPRPEHAYRWVGGSRLSEAATVTVVTGAPVEAVLEAFGADPQQPEAIRDIEEDLYSRRSVDPWVAVLDSGEAVLAVEYNGYEGSHEPVLRAASARGRAASMFWNVKSMTRLSFAERGRLLTSFEPWGDIEAEPAVAAVLTGLDFDQPGDRRSKGLVAVERFTGRGIAAEDLARIETAGIGFRIVPQLPMLYPYHPPSVKLLPTVDAAAVEQLPDGQLYALAWWVAGEAARHVGMAADPDVAASVAGRVLTDAAVARARASRLDGGAQPWLWRALHHATNPDARAALVNAFDAARYAAGPHAAELWRACVPGSRTSCYGRLPGRPRDRSTADRHPASIRERSPSDDCGWNRSRRCGSRSRSRSSQTPAARPARWAAPRAERSPSRAVDLPAADVGLQLHQRRVAWRRRRRRARCVIGPGVFSAADDVLDLERDRLQRGPGELRQAGAQGEAGDQPGGFGVPPRRAEAVERRERCAHRRCVASAARSASSSGVAADARASQREGRAAGRGCCPRRA